MSRTFPLATVLRVRRAQTGLARIQVAAAHRARADAAGDVVRRESDLRDFHARALPDEPRAVVAALSGGVTRAGEVHEARARLAAQDEQVDQAVASWQAARARERALELLADRHAARLAAEQAAADQHAADDRAATAVARHRAGRSPQGGSR